MFNQPNNQCQLDALYFQNRLICWVLVKKVCNVGLNGVLRIYLVTIEHLKKSKQFLKRIFYFGTRVSRTFDWNWHDLSERRLFPRPQIQSSMIISLLMVYFCVICVFCVHIFEASQMRNGKINKWIPPPQSTLIEWDPPSIYLSIFSFHFLL